MIAQRPKAANSIGSAVAVFALAMSAQAQTVIRVPQHYSTIQLAIDAAANGDTVLVAPGTYVENIDFIGKAITVTSEGGPEVTLVDGNLAGTVVRFGSGEGRSSVLNGFTLFNGRSGSGLPTLNDGGGIWISHSSPTITGNIISNNRACGGMGISNDRGSPLIQRNTITNNRAEGCSGRGGGILIENDSTPRPRTEIFDNIISGNVAAGEGAGILTQSNEVAIRGNIVSGNSAGGNCGGGISTGGGVIVVQNVITGNKASCGGGIYWRTGRSGQLVVNNTIADNDSASGSGIRIESFVEAAPEFANNIVIGKAGQTAVQCVSNNGVGPPRLRFNNAFAPSGTAYGGACAGQAAANGNISADPLFVDQAGGNYRLQEASPSLEAGDTTVSQTAARDIDGNARIVDADGNGSALIDQGAHERIVLLSPGAHDFGAIDLGSAPSSATFRISNPGASSITVSSIDIGNRVVGAGGPGDFTLAAGGPEPCPSLAPVLASGEGCTVAVTFTTPATLGRKGATLRVVSDAPGSPALAPLLAAVVIDTALDSAPPERTTSGVVTFTFSANAEGATFECDVEGQGPFACTSPQQYNRPTIGAHTFQVRAISKLGDPDPTPAFHQWNVVPRAKHADFDGDSRSDILWRNAGTGENYVYSMNGASIAGEGNLRTVADLNWRVAGLGDFDGDGLSDILWRNAATGENYVYFMNGLSIMNEGYLRTVADLNWQVAGVGDFDGDGKSDVLWRNTVTGENYLFLMDGLLIKPTESYLRTVADPGWQVAGVADFDGSGKADILWRNAANGENYLYFMNGVSIVNEGYLRTVADTAWEIKGIADFDGDLRPDILWRNRSSGQNYLYPMSGTVIKANEGPIRTVNLAWQIAAVGDYDGDGRADILWRNETTGENYLFPMNGTAIKPTEGYVRSVPPGDWTIVGK